MKQCYFCEEEGTTVEHVPPRCLFPKHSLVGRDLRKNLMTVPSCLEHNCEKNGLDEHLRQVLVGSPFTNEVGRSLLSDKWVRALERNAKAFDEMFNGGRLMEYQLDEDQSYQTGMYKKFDFSKVDESLYFICRALYFKDTGIKLEGVASLITVFTMYMDQRIQMRNNNEIEQVRFFFKEFEAFGENPEVFYYKRRYTKNLKTFYLVFYEGNEALVRFQ